MTEKLGEYMNSVTSQNITFNRNIEMQDLEGNTKNICSCYCTIEANKSCSYYFDVLEPVIFASNKAKIQPEIDKYKKECQELALKYNVPII